MVETRGTEWDELGATGISRDFHEKGPVPNCKLIWTMGLWFKLV